MRVITGAELRSALHVRTLVERLRQSFRGVSEAPPRHRYTIPTYGKNSATLDIAPVWQTGRGIGVRLATHFPDNAAKDVSPAQGVYILFDGKTGVAQGYLDNAALMRRRAAAASVLAATYLARLDAERLLVVGTGPLALELIEAYTAVLPIKRVLVWGRDAAKAQRLAQRFHRPKFRIETTDDLEGAVRGANIVACATAAEAPLIRGDWLMPGVHLDLLGGVSPGMREADDACIAKARVFVDARDGTPAEAGDIVQPLANGTLRADDIAGDLFELTRGERAGRRYYDQITLYKSVGVAIEDLTAAQLAVETVAHNETIR
jgi:ornithine cyclodeaminase/alanine dehydrogenase-like protein (mu-crystallin family)